MTGGSRKQEVGTPALEVGTIASEVGTIASEVGTIASEVGTNRSEVGTIYRVNAAIPNVLSGSGQKSTFMDAENAKRAGVFGYKLSHKPVLYQGTT